MTKSVWIKGKIVTSPIHRNPLPIQTVLRDIAGQENCDGMPYGQMVIAADYIDGLEDFIAKTLDIIKKIT